LESTITRTVDGMDFIAYGGKKQMPEVPQSVRMKLAVKQPVWKSQCQFQVFPAADHCRKSMLSRSFASGLPVSSGF